MNNGSDRFEQMLKDLKETIKGKGLAQDISMNDYVETVKLLIIDIIRIDKQEGLSERSIFHQIENVLKLDQQGLSNLTLIHCLAMLLDGRKPNKNGAIDITKLSKLPHDSETASFMFTEITEKFFSCTEKERRRITRSDPEFVQMVKDVIIFRSGFSNEREAFGREIPVQVPKLKRGKELFWHGSGDPKPEIPPKNKEMFANIKNLIHIVLQKLEELYPDLYTNLSKYFERMEGLIQNTDNPAYNKLVNAKDEKEFNSIAIPNLIDSLVISFLVRPDLYVDVHKQRTIRQNLIDAVLLATSK